MYRPIINNSVFSDPTVLPLRSIAEITTDSLLAIAPHPDDETLGCGGAIALLRSLGYRVNVLVISDGTMSHPRSRKYPKPRLRSLRETETRSATITLGMEESAVDFLQLPDGAIPTSESPDFAIAVEMCRDRIFTLNPDTILLPWRFDPHPDHRASWELIRTALVSLNLPRSPRLIEYPIWDWDETQRGTPISDRFTAWRLDISQVLEVKKQAIAAYRSQTTNLIDDDPEGFRLTPEMLANFTRNWEVYIEEL